MPCGGIYPVLKEARNRCWQCDGPGGDHFCEEWDTHLHRDCIPAFLVSEEGLCMMSHGHSVVIGERDSDLDQFALLLVNAARKTWEGEPLSTWPVDRMRQQWIAVAKAAKEYLC